MTLPGSPEDTIAALFDRTQAALPGRYTLERELRSGGMGTVFLGREEHPNRRVAIKVMEPSLTAQLGRDRFLREVDVASNLTHPHIVPIFAAGEAGDLLYYVMPFIEGESLYDRLAEHEQLDLEEALHIAGEVADALEAAHQQGVIHRDVKPGNILLQGGHAMVTDFGIASALSEAGAEPITKTGMVLGTPAYMSPEQVTETGKIDGRADVYALGCVLYEMIGGEPPFTGRNARVVISRQMIEPVPSLRALRSPLPWEIERVVTKALAKAPADRYRTAAEFSKALKKCSRDADLLSASGGRVAWAAAKAKRNVVPALIGAGVVAVLLAIWRPWTGPGIPAQVSPYVDSVAVLPLENHTGDSTLDYLSDVLATEIRTELQHYDRLKVISRHSVQSVHGGNLTTPQLADTLRARLLLSGTLRYRDDRLSAYIEVVDGSDASLMIQRFDEDPTDTLAFATEVAHGVTEAFTGAFPGLGSPRVDGRHVRGPAYDAHLTGRSALLQRTRDGFLTAFASFDSAIALDPGYAPAYASLASAYALALTYRYEIGMDGYEIAARSLSMANRAIDLDANLAGAYAARGYLGALVGVPTAEIAADFDRAKQLDPNAPNIPSWSARVLAQMGRTEEAFSEAERAVQLDPISAGRHIAVAYLSLHLRRFDRGIAAARRAVAIQGQLYLPRAIQARSLLLNGQAEECLAIELGPHAVLRATCLHAVGRQAEAAAIVDSVVASLDDASADSMFTDVVRLEDLAVHFAQLGDPEESARWLERAYEESPTGVERRVFSSPLFDRVRDDPRFLRRAEDARAAVWPRVRNTVGDVQLP